jgi:SAM-dependent methyltransferase
MTWEATAVTEASCPICRSFNTSLHLDDEEEALEPSLLGSSRAKTAHGRILRCASCGFGFRERRSNPAEMAEFYRRLDAGVYESETAGRKATAARNLGILQRFTSGGGRLLDAGCASGHFLYQARQAGWLIAGVEPSESLYSKARETLGSRAEIYCCILENTSFAPASFDAITLWDVLEHVAEPVDFMKLCATLLKPGGRLFVNVPDLDSLEAQVFGRRWPLLLAEHLNYFNRASLSLCGKLAGLTWVHFGRRRASFSLDYILFRLAQHGTPCSSAARKLARPFARRVSLPIYLGETFGVFVDLRGSKIAAD